MSDRIYSINWQPTLYNGIIYRSKLEARWAVFFNSLGVIHSYEPRTFYFPEHGGDLHQYTPDFGILTEYDFIEIKFSTPTNTEYAKVRILSQRGYKCAIFAGGCNPDVQVYLFENGSRKYVPRSSAFLQQCFQFKLNGRQGETVAALKTVLGKHRNWDKAFREAWEFKA